MKIIIDNPDFFRNALMLVREIILEPFLVFDKDGLTVEGNDMTMISYLRLFIPDKFFASYNLEEKESYCLKISDLIDVLRKVPNKAVIVMEVKDNLFVVKGKADRVFKYQFSLIEKNPEQVTKPKDASFDVSFTVQAKLLLDMVDAGFDNQVVFSVENSMFCLNSGDVLTGFSEQKIKVNAQKNCEAKYDKDYISRVLKYLARLSKSIEVKFGKDYPLMLSVKDDLTAEFFLAPIVENK